MNMNIDFKVVEVPIQVFRTHSLKLGTVCLRHVEINVAEARKQHKHSTTREGFGG